MNNNFAVGRPIRVLLVDDHEVVRAGLRAICSSNHMTVVGEASNSQEMMDQVGATMPDVVVTEAELPGVSGIQVVLDLKKRFSNIRVVMLTTCRLREYAMESIKAGVYGYILKDSQAHEIVAAIKAAYYYEHYFSPIVASYMAQECVGSASGRKQKSQELSAREREIIRLIVASKSNKEMATLLSLSVKTIEKHRSNFMKKLDLHSSVDVVRYALANGLAQTEIAHAEN